VGVLKRRGELVVELSPRGPTQALPVRRTGLREAGQMPGSQAAFKVFRFSTLLRDRARPSKPTLGVLSRNRLKALMTICVGHRDTRATE
jgi:hypothetical protein